MILITRKEKRKFEIAAWKHSSSVFREYEGTLDWGPLGKNVCYANCTHIMVSILKAWKVTLVGIECNGASFLTSFQEGPHQKLFFQGFFQILQVRWQPVLQLS